MRDISYDASHQISYCFKQNMAFFMKKSFFYRAFRNWSSISTITMIGLMSFLFISFIMPEKLKATDVETYTLNINFNIEDLKLIDQIDQKVILIKEVDGGGNRVVWMTFKPSQNNKITWEEDFFLYASPSQPIENEQIIGWTMQKAEAQNEYTFNYDRSFSTPEYNARLNPRQYMIINKLPFDHEAAFTFGMAQSFNINGQQKSQQPLNASLVPAQQFTKFSSTDIVLLFLASNIKDNSVHNDVRFNTNISNSFLPANVESTATKLDFNISKEISVKYSAEQGKFIQQSI